MPCSAATKSSASRVKREEIPVMGRSGEAADPGIFDLLYPPVLADALPIRADPGGVSLHRGMHVEQRAVRVEHRGLDLQDAIPAGSSAPRA